MGTGRLDCTVESETAGGNSVCPWEVEDDAVKPPASENKIKLSVCPWEHTDPPTTNNKSISQRIYRYLINFSFLYE